jgi:hypothetical protein
MQGWSEATDALSVVKRVCSPLILDCTYQTGFPWASLPKGAIVNDLGGGTGSVLLEIAREHQHLQLVLQDLPKQIEIAETEFWPKEYPEALEQGRITFTPVDFLTESPVASCDVYYVSGHTNQMSFIDAYS